MDKISQLLCFHDKGCRRAYEEGTRGTFSLMLNHNSEEMNNLALELNRLDMGRKVLQAAIKLGKLSVSDIQELTELTFRKDESDRFMSRLAES